MLKKGTSVLTFWCIVNVLPGIGSLVFLAQGQHAPALQMRFIEADVPTLDPRTLAVVDGLAVIANSLIVVYCVTALWMVRRCLARGERWAFWVLALGCLALQIAGYTSDHLFFLGQNLLILHVSSALLILGFGLSWAGLRRRSA